MKNRNKIAFFFVALSLIISCVSEEIEDHTGKRTVRLIARMESLPAETKAELEKSGDGKYYAIWESKDTLAVFSNPGQNPAAFTLIEGDGTTEATFEGAVSGEQFVAFSPYQVNTEYKDGRLFFTLPRKQNGFFPMVAKSEDGNLQFRNLCSIIKISLTGGCFVGSITLHSDSQFLSGPAYVNVSYEGNPQLVMREGGCHDVTLECGVLLSSDSYKDFFIILPANTYDGLTISIDTFTDTVSKNISHEVVLKRSELRPVTPFLLEAPMIDLDNLPDNIVLYKTKSGKKMSFDKFDNQPFDAGIVTNTYNGDFGIIVLDAPLKQVHDNAFNGWQYPDVTELYLPDCVEDIGSFALPDISSFRVPKSLRSLGWGNVHLVGQVYGPLVGEDGHGVVSNEGVLLGVFGAYLEEYTTPKNVQSIGPYCFGNIGKLIISEGVKRIKQYAFYYCTIKEIWIPESVERIEQQWQISGLEGFYGNSKCITDDHLCLINPRESAIVSIVPNADLEEFVIPEGITTIASSFSNWPNLKRVIFPESFDRFVHFGLFDNCPNAEGFGGPLSSEDGRCLIQNGSLMAIHGKGITNYTIPSGVISIEMSSLFKSCEGDIENLTVSEGTARLNQFCFEAGFSLRSVSLPTTIKYIGPQVFDRCENLESVFLPVRIPPVVLGRPSDTFLPKLTVYVPEESYDSYMSNTDWNGSYGQYLQPYHFDIIDPPTPYRSTDYSQDGKVIVLQTASEGNGIDLVLMGDGFTDIQVADGTYQTVLERAMDAFFSVEPYYSFRHLFNVLAVKTVSENDDPWQAEGHALSSQMLGEFDINSDINKGIEYALKAVPESKIDETTIVVILNANGLPAYNRPGICSMAARSYTPQTDYGSGCTVSVLTTVKIDEVLHHEAGGHGFAKLDDEYTTRCYSDDPPSEEYITTRSSFASQYGWYKNIDFSPNPQSVKWSVFLSDPRYEEEKLGVFEGGGAYWRYGVYRPSETSIMDDNLGGFNAPSREAIYYRIHKLAYGPEWEYNYEDFVKWDQGAKNIQPTATPQSVSGKKTYEVREPLPSKPFNPDEWTVTVMK